MTFLLELRERFFQIVGKREKLALAAVKFVLALVAFVLINATVGYMEQAGNPALLAGLSVICAFAPVSLTVFFAAVLILLNFYALALELCVIALLLFVLMFCLYFRFTKDSGYFALLTPIFSWLRIPYVIPNAVGLTGKPYNVVAVLCGSMVFFLLKNVRDNEALFRSFEESSELAVKFTLAANQIFVNKEMFVYMIAFVAAALVVYFVRKSSMDHAWGISVILGSVIQFVVVGGGMIAIGNVRQVVVAFVGGVAALAISAGLMFVIRTLDYSRVERVEFEDEDYYYYVKAVPKASMELEDREVKQIATKKHKAVRASGRLKKNAVTGTGPVEELGTVQQKTAPTAEEKVQEPSAEAKEAKPEKTDKKSGKKPSKRYAKKGSKKADSGKKAVSEEDEIARKVMEEFDVEGEWLE